jgi:hypothetical protein
MAYRNPYNARRGTTAALRVVFRQSGALFNPNDISVEIYDPNMTLQSTLVPAAESLGTYVASYPVTDTAKLGTWVHRWRWQALAGMAYHSQDYTFQVISAGRDLGSDLMDLSFIEDTIEEGYLLHYPPYPYYVLQTAQVADLNTYGELDYEDSDHQEAYYDASVEVPMMVRLDPEQDLLDKFGIDEPQESLITLSRKHMEGLGITPKIGDRFDLNNFQFEFKTMKPGSWFSTTLVPCEYIATADKTHGRNPA